MATDAESVVQSALSWLREGRRVALATVIKTWSSSPYFESLSARLSALGRAT